MVSPVRNSLDSYYALNPLSSFSFGFTDTHIQQKSEKRKKKETILGEKKGLLAETSHLKTKKTLGESANDAKELRGRKGGLCYKPDSDSYRIHPLNT